MPEAGDDLVEVKPAWIVRNGWKVIRAAYIGFCILYFILFIVTSAYSSSQATSAAFAPETDWAAKSERPQDGWTEILFHYNSSNVADYITSWRPFPVCGGDICAQPKPAYDYTSVFDDLIKLEVSFSSFNPGLSGGTAAATFTAVLPEYMMDFTQSPERPGYTVVFQIDEYVFTVSPTSPSVKGSYNQFQFDVGTVLQYPFDVFIGHLDISCYVSTSDPRFPIISWDEDNGVFEYYPKVNGSYSIGVKGKSSATPTDKSCTRNKANKIWTCPQSDPIQLNFAVKISSTDVGLFAHEETYSVPDEIILKNGQVFAVAASIEVTMRRPTIGRVFPVILACIFWIAAMGQTFVVFSHVVGLKKVDVPALVMAAAPIIFALPGIRSQMPGSPPVGIVLDWLSYFWCLFIAVSNFGVMGVLYFYVSALETEKKK